MSAKNNNKKFSDLLFFRLHLVHSTSSPSFNSEKINHKKGKCRTSASFAENINNKNNHIINVVSDTTVDDTHRRSNINVVDITNKIDHNNRSVNNNRENNNHQQHLALVAAENFTKPCDKNKNYFINNHHRESGSEKENLSNNSSSGGNSDTSSGGSMRFVS